jgi:uncharacterized protein (DUF58 family)
MTVLARLLALPALAGVLLGVLRGQPGLALVSLSVLMWLFAGWLWFLFRQIRELPSVRVERFVNERNERSGLLWAGRLVHVRVRVTTATGSLRAGLRVRDAVPDNMQVLDAAHDIRLTQTAREVTFRYTARVCGAGRLRLPGFRLELTDGQGFFTAVKFVAVAQEFRVLPAYAEPGDKQPVVKRINALPQHGIHRLQRSGMGSELLELRDYVSGDPPKSIAWKVSARRGRLMTRQYESEVPVRVQLFLDGSFSTRVGGFGQRLLDQLTYTAASVARLAISAGDPVGAVLFDERRQVRIAPATGERGFHKLLESIADFCINPAPLPERLTPELLHTALSVAAEQFPELLDVRVNRVPFSLPGLLPWRVRSRRTRFLLAGVLAELYSLTPAQHVRLLHDDPLLATYAQHFLSQTGMAWLLPVVAIRQRHEQDGLLRMQLLSQSLMVATTHARDNEVFVILADLLDCAPAISHLLPAIRMARARHHRIVIACPTPTFVRPTAASLEVASDSVTGLLRAAEQARARDLSLQLQKELRRCGAMLAMTGEQNAIRLVLSEMELARTGRLSASGSRAPAGAPY